MKDLRTNLRKRKIAKTPVKKSALKVAIPANNKNLLVMNKLAITLLIEKIKVNIFSLHNSEIIDIKLGILFYLLYIYCDLIDIAEDCIF